MLSRSKENFELSTLYGKIIVVEASVSAGKSSLCRSLYNYLTAHGFHVKLFEEKVNKKFLDLYLSDMKHYAWCFQSIILSERIRIHEEALEWCQKGYVCLIDRGCLGDMSFAYMQHQKGFFTDREYEVYKSMIDEKHIVEPHYMVYLKCSPETTMRRLHMRGNQSEIDCYSIEYLQNLISAHEVLIKSYNGLKIEVVWDIDLKLETGLLSHKDCYSFLHRMITDSSYGALRTSSG